MPVLFAAALAAAAAAADRGLSPIDALAEARPRHRFTPEIWQPLLREGAQVHVNESLGVPSFLWAAPRAAAAGGTSSLRRFAPEAAARLHLADYAGIYGLSPRDARAAVLQELHDTGAGPIVARFRQVVGGIEVFRDELRVVMDRELELVAMAGWLSPHAAAAERAPLQFRLGIADAVARGLHDLAGLGLAASDLQAGEPEPGGYDSFTPRAALPGGLVLSAPIRAKKVLFHHPDRLEPAHFVEVQIGAKDSTDGEAWATVLSAIDGRVLFRHDLVQRDSFSYRVWAEPTGLMLPYDGPQASAGTPHPTGTPDRYQAPFAVPSLVTLQNGPIGNSDPWLAPGATETRGNNADAYTDLATPDGFGTGDFRASTTAPGTFDRTFDVAATPGANLAQQMAVVTQLFYDVNFFHDWYYASGFDEKAGNAQAANFGRGGIENDALRAEAQDVSGRNNANMSTPPDGRSPRMQMYIFDANPQMQLVVQSPAPVAGTLDGGRALFGPVKFDVTAQVVAVDDGTDPRTDACEAIANATALAGKIAFIDRGTCTFVAKVQAAQAVGAVGVVIANNAPGFLNMAGDDPGINIGSIVITQDEGNALRAQLGNNVVARLVRNQSVDLDGGLDNQIIAHEWGHMISNRLIGNAVGLNNRFGSSLGEGWADFHSLMMTVRPEDAGASANANFGGAYAVAAYVSSGPSSQGYYFGIRRYPYSTDLTKDPLTFKHIEDDVALPGGVPRQFAGTNSEVHNSGEVWATMLWECWAALLRDTGRLTFAQARDRMKDYIVASYKITPSTPTLLEARDALLAAAFARDKADYALFWQAFAKRGAGTRAVAPDRFSSTNAGVVESFSGGSDLFLVSAVLDDSTTALCTADGILDRGETGKLTITIKNVGPGALSATSATVSTTDAAVTFPSGATATFATTQPYGTATASVPVALASTVSGLKVIDFKITLADSGMSAPLAVTVPQRVNHDVVANQSPIDDFEADTTIWTPGGTWKRLAASTIDHRFQAPTPGLPSDQSLVSPPLAVPSAADFTFTFRHRHFFPAFLVDSVVEYPDGGFLEISVDDGATWKDIGTFADPGYNGTLAKDWDNTQEGRPAYVFGNTPYPQFQTVTVKLARQYAGKAVRVRFRVATGDTVARPGWEIDDVNFSGIANLPFASFVGGGSKCNRAPVANAGAAQSANEKTQVTLDGRASSDPDGDSISYRWVQKSGTAATIADDTVAAPSVTLPALQKDEVLTFSLVVDDGQLKSAPATVDVSVKNLNSKPVAVAGTEQKVAANAAVSLDGSASSDPDGDTLTFAWTQTSGTTVTLSDAASAKPTFKAPGGGGKLVFQLVVNDGALASDPASVTVNVDKSGCGCASGGSTAPLALFGLLLVAMRRSRRSSRR